MTAAPKELARRGLSDGADRLGRQFRDSGQQGQPEDLGQTQLEEGISGTSHGLSRGGEQLLRKVKRSIGRNSKDGTAQANPRSADAGPISSTGTDLSFGSERPSNVTAPSSRVKTREAYYSQQTADTASSGKHFQGKRTLMQERTAEKAVRERAKESGQKSRPVDTAQAGIPGESPVNQGKGSFPAGRISANIPTENTASVHGAFTGKRTVGRSVGQQVSREVRQAAKGKALAVEAAKAAAQAVGRTLRAMVAAARELLVSLAAGGSVCVLLVVVLCMIGLLAASPFGILFAGESGIGSVPVSAAVAQVNYDLNDRLESLQSGSYDEIRIIG